VLRCQRSLRCAIQFLRCFPPASLFCPIHSNRAKGTPAFRRVGNWRSSFSS
jgi:hypothetical protein